MPLPSSPSSLDTYGSAKLDYSDPVDGSTDRSAAEVNQAFTDVGEMTRMTFKARLTFTIDGYVILHQALWGNALALKPAYSKTGTGVFAFTLPASITDELGNVHAVSVDAGLGNVAATTALFANVKVTSANTFTVYTWLGTSATDPGNGVQVSVWLS